MPKLIFIENQTLTLRRKLPESSRMSGNEHSLSGDEQIQASNISKFLFPKDTCQYLTAAVTLLKFNV